MDAELHAILDQWNEDEVIQPFPLKRSATKQDKGHPHFCCYHQYVGNPTLACQAVRMIFHAKIKKRTLKLSTKKQNIEVDPLPCHREMVVVATVMSDTLLRLEMEKSLSDNQRDIE